jgi:hypothetical protein
LATTQEYTVSRLSKNKHIFYLSSSHVINNTIFLYSLTFSLCKEVYQTLHPLSSSSVVFPMSRPSSQDINSLDDHPSVSKKPLRKSMSGTGVFDNKIMRAMSKCRCGGGDSVIVYPLVGFLRGTFWIADHGIRCVIFLQVYERRQHEWHSLTN